jgi:hypothetical protein
VALGKEFFQDGHGLPGVVLRLFFAAQSLVNHGDILVFVSPLLNCGASHPGIKSAHIIHEFF